MDLLGVLQVTQHHRRGGKSQRQRDDQRRGRFDIQEIVGDQEDADGGNHHLDTAIDEDEPLQRSKAPQRKLQADGEHEEHDAELGDLPQHLGIVEMPEIESVGDDGAGGDVANDLGDTQALEQDVENDGDGQCRGDVEHHHLHCGFAHLHGVSAGCHVPHRVGDGIGQIGDLGRLRALHHHADQRFGTGRTQQHAAIGTQGRFGIGDGRIHPVVLHDLRRHRFAQPHVHQHLRQARHAQALVAQAGTREDHGGQHLQRGHDAVTGGGTVTADDVSRGFAPQGPAVVVERLQDEPVAHVGTQQLHAQLLEGQFQPEVGHARAHHLALEPVGLLEARARDDVENAVTIDDAALVIHHDETVTITVEGDSQVGAMLQHRLLQGLGMGGTDALVDIETVGLVADDDDVGAQLVEDVGRDVIGGAIGAIHHHGQAAQVQAGRHRALAELDVAPGSVLHAFGLAQLLRRHRVQGPVHLGLDGLFQLVWQLAATAGEELDPVVVIGVVRGADHDPGRGTEGAGEIGDAGRGHGTEQRDVHAGSHQARFERGFEHVAGDPGVLADEHLAAPPLPQDPAGRPAELEYQFGVDLSFPHPAPDTVGTKVFSSHRLLPPLQQ